MARVKMVTLINPNISNMSFLLSMMELKRGKFTAEITQIISGVTAFDGKTRVLTTSIYFDNFERAEVFCNQMGLLCEEKPAWMQLNYFRNNQSPEPEQAAFNFDGMKEAAE